MKTLPLWEENITSQEKSQKKGTSQSEIVNVASVRKLSPFRYPGGKTWLVPVIRNWLNSLPIRPNYLIEPFAGGAIVSLTAVFEDITDFAVLCELDEQVASLWKLILSDGEWLAEQILSFEMSRQNVHKVLNKEPNSLRDQGFRTLILNRVHRGGILAPGASMMKEGENGRGLSSRWYPQTLAKRVLEIHNRRNRFIFIQGDALAVMAKYRKNPTDAFFVDPPYTIGGKRAGSRLYKYNEINHDLLFKLLSSVKGNFVATYDDTPEVLELAGKYGFAIRKILMKNTHHSKQFELLITRE